MRPQIFFIKLSIDTLFGFICSFVMIFASMLFRGKMMLKLMLMTGMNLMMTMTEYFDGVMSICLVASWIYNDYVV